jgi:5'-nucleotidase
MKKITIYHTNDLHSNFEHFASIVTYLKENRQSEDLLLDAGDFCDFKNTMINGTQGRAGKTLLNHAGYDAICIGNNEGFSGVTALEAMAEDELPLLSINLMMMDKTPVKNVQPSIILEKSGIRFLIIGVSPYFGEDSEGKYNVFFNMDGLHAYNPIPLIKSTIQHHQGSYDFVILLSHQGIQIDEKIATAIDGIDLIIGGHSHTVVKEPYLVNQTIIHTAGEYGKLIGKLELTIDHGTIIQFKGESIPNTFTQDPSTLSLIDQQTSLAQQLLSQTLYTISSLDHSMAEESELANFICDALKKEHPCDFAIINHGIVNHALSGDISKMKLLECAPSPLNPTLIKVSGHQLIEAIKLSMDPEHIHHHGRGPGFRGHCLGTLAFSSNVELHFNPLNIIIDSQPLDTAGTYEVMTDDYLQRGSGYPSLAYPDEHSTFFAGFIRDLLERNLNDAELMVTAKRLRRIQ